MRAHGSPEDLLRHECLTFRSQTTGVLYAWELERGRKSWRIPVRGGIVGNDASLLISLAEQGLGLIYAFEPTVLESLKQGRLQRALEAYSPTVPGFFLYYPSRSRSSPPLRAFVEALKGLGPPDATELAGT